MLVRNCFAETMDIKQKIGLEFLPGKVLTWICSMLLIQVILYMFHEILWNFLLSVLVSENIQQVKNIQKRNMFALFVFYVKHWRQMDFLRKNPKICNKLLYIYPVQYRTSFLEADGSPLLWYDILLSETCCSVNAVFVLDWLIRGEMISKGVSLSTVHMQRDTWESSWGRAHMHTSSLHGGGRITHSVSSIQSYFFAFFFFIYFAHWIQKSDGNKLLFPFSLSGE